jgi:hypothetical protein
VTQHFKQEVNWDFLLASSKSTLQAYEMSRLNLAANVRKEIVQLLDAWVNENSSALLARWLIERDLAADAGEICADPQPQSSEQPCPSNLGSTGGPLPCPHHNAHKREPGPSDLGATGGPLPRTSQNTHKPPSRRASSTATQAESASDNLFGDKRFAAPRIHVAS